MNCTYIVFYILIVLSKNVLFQASSDSHTCTQIPKDTCSLEEPRIEAPLSGLDDLLYLLSHSWPIRRQPI